MSASILSMLSVLALSGCGLLDSEPPPLPAGDPQRPDIIVVSIDTLRADHLSTYGYERPTSPFIDELAAKGTRFDHARSPSPWTLPAHTTLMTGQHIETHRVIEDDFSVDPSTPVLAEAIQAAGYRTAGFVSTMYVSSLFDFQRGFDRFEDFDLHTEKKNLSGDVTMDQVVDGAAKWWAEQPAGEPVFLFLHTYDVHYAYDPPAPFDTKFDRAPTDDDPKYKNYFYFHKKPLTDAQMAHKVAQYDESIAWVDSELARLDAMARAAGRTVRWVITSDHGEEFGERGSWGHAHTLYSEQLHIPLVVSERTPDGSAGSLPAGSVVKGTAGLHDIAPTVAAWVDGAGALQPDGVDLAPAMAGEPLPERAFPAQTSRFKTNRVGLYQDGLRIEWDLKDDRVELFAPLEDPDETRDLAAERPDDVARLKQRFAEIQGQPWQVDAAGTVVTDKSARVLVDGQVSSRKAVLPGTTFQVLPYDGTLRFRVGRESLGPFSAMGGQPPGADMPVKYSAAQGGPKGVVLDEATRKALEAIGYIQSEAEGEE